MDDNVQTWSDEDGDLKDTKDLGQQKKKTKQGCVVIFNYL